MIALADTSTSSTTLTIDPAATSGATITAADENDRNNDTSTAFNAHVHTLSNTTNWGDGSAGDKLLCADSNNATDSCIKWNDTDNLWQVDNPAGTFGQIVTATGTSGLTTKALLLGDGTSSIVALTDGLGTSGEFLQSQGAGSEPIWATQASSLTWIASETTEQTDSTGSAADILTISSLSITAATPIVVIANLRKTSGAAVAADVGVKLNASQVIPNEPWSTASDVADQGFYFVIIGPRVAGYTGSSLAIGSDSIEQSGGPGFIGGASSNSTTDTITSITITGDSNNSSVTMGVDEVHVYTLSTS